MDPEGTASLVADRRVVEDVVLHHEFFHLLREQFDKLPQHTQRAYLSIVERGTDPSGWLAYKQRETGQGQSQEEADRYVRHWQYEMLWPIQQYLDRHWQELFAALRREFGELPHSDFPVFIEGWVGPTSPTGVEDLSTMSVEQLVAYLKEWQPSGEPMTPTPEGLGQALSVTVAGDPQRFAAEAMSFQGLDPTYVRALLMGLRDASEKKIPFPWEPVLVLCKWVLDQPRQIPGRQRRYGDQDPSWVWTRKAIVDLLAFRFVVSKVPSSLGHQSAENIAFSEKVGCLPP